MPTFTGQIDVNKLQEVFNTKIIPNLGDKIVLTKDYLLELGSRYIYYKIFINSLGLLLGILLAIVTYKVALPLTKKEYLDYEDDSSAFIAVVIGTLSILLIVLCIFNIGSWLYIPEINIYQSLVR